jgi:MoxR-like ATPase
MNDSRNERWTAEAVAEVAKRWKNEVERVVRGKQEVVHRVVLALLARGHILLDDVPGVGKTTLVQALSKTLAGEFRRVQFTSDLLPGDITGMSVPESAPPGGTPTFHFQPGPLFCNLLLADEVNRASPKTQSALLEAMGENTVSIDGVTHPLPKPFLVVATQNPLEHHGTHPLPESQRDRFLMRLSLGYPDRQHEEEVLTEDPSLHTLPHLEPVLTTSDLAEMQRLTDGVHLEASVRGYLLDVIEATRSHDALALGVSTRGAIALRRSAQANAIMDGRDYCTPDDVKDLAVDVLAHRVLLSVHGGGSPDQTESRWILSDLLERVPVPL